MFPHLLAADVGNWIGLAVLVLTVLGWIVNAIKGNDPEGKPLPQRARPKRDLRSEIDVFLEELQQKPGAEPPREAPREVLTREPAERPRGDKPRKPNPQQPKATKAKGNKSSGTKSSPGQPGPNQPGPNRPGPNRPGQGIREHVSSYMAENRVGAEVQQHLAHRVDQAVQRDLSGGTVAAVESVSSPVTAPHPLMALLLRPEGVRQAILMNEILQRPRALRERHGSRS